MKHKIVVLFSIILIIISLSSTIAMADMVVLGESGEFAIEKEDSWKVYTPVSDYSEVKTTIGYLFEHFDEYVGAIKTDDYETVIAYYPTTDNSKLSEKEKLMKCMDQFGENANFFNTAFVVIPYNCGYELYQSGQDYFSNDEICYSYIYVFLENGIVEIGGTSFDAGISDFNYDVMLHICTSAENDLIFRNSGQ